jgi:hypothetical protein
LAGCVSKRESDPSLDRLVKPARLGPASAVATTVPEIVALGPLTMTANQYHAVLKRAIAVAEGPYLHVIASASEKLDCDGPLYPPKAEWLEFRLDSGPLGDFYADAPTNVTIDFALLGDTAEWREAHPAAARVQMTSLTAEVPSVKVEMKRALTNPEPRTPTIVNGAGSVELTVCPSALALLATAHAPTVEKGPAVATFGDVTFPLRSALAFVFDDGKNATVVTGITLYEAEEVSCDAASRAISDHGGGVSGRQIQIGLAPLGAGRKATRAPGAVIVEALDVTTGEAWFEQQYIPKAALRGFLRIDAADLTEDPLFGAAPRISPPPPFTGVKGTIHAESPEGRVSGTFTASICKRPW